LRGCRFEIGGTPISKAAVAGGSSQTLSSAPRVRAPAGVDREKLWALGAKRRAIRRERMRLMPMWNYGTGEVSERQPGWGELPKHFAAAGERFVEAERQRRSG